MQKNVYEECGDKGSQHIAMVKTYIGLTRLSLDPKETNVLTMKTEAKKYLDNGFEIIKGVDMENTITHAELIFVRGNIEDKVNDDKDQDEQLNKYLDKCGVERLAKCYILTHGKIYPDFRQKNAGAWIKSVVQNSCL